MLTDVRLACSQEAGEWLYGKKKFEIIPNGIDFEKYKFDLEKRKLLRNKMKLEGKFVIGHIGRFSYEKNQAFLIDVFRKIKNKNADAKLVLTGDGEEKDAIQKKAKEYGINEDIHFLGNVNNVFELINVFDVFVFPSIYEGLPLTLLEVQANGLNAVISSQISNEVILTDLIQKIPLDNIDVWISTIMQRRRGENLEKYNDIMLKSKFNIDYVICRMKKIYK